MEERTGMTTAQVGYTPVYRWVKHVLGKTHTTVVATIAWAVLCLLVAQRVTPAVLARALPAAHAGSGRSRLRRIRRWWGGPALDQATISPALIRLTLALGVAAKPVVVALDTTRLGSWEVWLAGIVVAGRTLPIGWAVLPTRLSHFACMSRCPNGTQVAAVKMGQPSACQKVVQLSICQNLTPAAAEAF